MRFVSRIVALAGALGLSTTIAQAQPVTLHGAVPFSDDHVVSRTLAKFEELVRQYYDKPVNFVLHRNSALGLERDYLSYMSQGTAVDYAIVAPVHMAALAKAASFVDAPFLFRDRDHWERALGADALKPVADELAAKADVMVIGYAGGSVRNIFARRPAGNVAEMKDLRVRVQGAPIWSRAFASIGLSPAVIAYNEIHGAIRNDAVAAVESDAAGVEVMKFHEVAPNLLPTGHAIGIRPICFSAKTFRNLPADLQAAILKAGKEAGVYGRQMESAEDRARLDALEKAGRLKRAAFADRAEMRELAAPVLAAYAKEIGAEEVYARIEATK